MVGADGAALSGVERIGRPARPGPGVSTRPGG